MHIPGLFFFLFDQPNQTIPNQIQASALMDLRCPKVLYNSCTDPYLLLDYYTPYWYNTVIRPNLLDRHGSSDGFKVSSKGTIKIAPPPSVQFIE